MATHIPSNLYASDSARHTKGCIYGRSSSNPILYGLILAEKNQDLRHMTNLQMTSVECKRLIPSDFVTSVPTRQPFGPQRRNRNKLIFTAWSHKAPSPDLSGRLGSDCLCNAFHSTWVSHCFVGTHWLDGGAVFGSSGLGLLPA